MIIQILARKAVEAVKEVYGEDLDISNFTISKTRKEFEGDYTLVVFPLTRISRRSPEQTAAEIGKWLQEALPEIKCYSIIKGFLNLSLEDSFWVRFLWDSLNNSQYGLKNAPETAPPVVVEFSSPNTNKPLHLGHIRNNLLGHSIAAILKACGQNVIKVNLVNDRGIHICKSMLAWKKWGQGETPLSSGVKGDHLVGKYYVLFDKHYKTEAKALEESGMPSEEAARQAPLMKEAQAMLRKWESGDTETVELWKTMNQWVYEGFHDTYKRLGIQFNKTYYESETYLLGKSLVEEGLKKGIFERQEDGSVWADFSAEGLDRKLLLRADGTSVYITQDLGTADLRYLDFHPDRMIYVVGNEQIYHFDVLKLLLQKLGKPYASGVYHLSYGMVELPQGKMKSREGTVVDADDLMDEMIRTAKETTLELGKAAEMEEDDANRLFQVIGMAALKYFILKVDPKKNMLFNPSESIDFDGNTGPFIQYTHARIRSVLRKAGEWSNPNLQTLEIQAEEKEILRLLYDFPELIEEAAATSNPSLIASHAYELARTYNQFYHQCPILKEANESKRIFRLGISDLTARVIKTGMELLGIEVPEKM